LSRLGVSAKYFRYSRIDSGIRPLHLRLAQPVTRQDVAGDLGVGATRERVAVGIDRPAGGLRQAAGEGLRAPRRRGQKRAVDVEQDDGDAPAPAGPPPVTGAPMMTESSPLEASRSMRV